VGYSGVVLLERPSLLEFPVLGAQSPADMRIVTIVHPINTDRHPSNAPGWRWAVMVGDGPYSEISRCANAGRAETQDQAMWSGDTCAATAVRAVRILGLPVGYAGVITLLDDPIPAEANQLNIV
jgi:hypothetical protein